MVTRSLARTSLVIAIGVMLVLPLAGICDGGRLAIGDVISVMVEGEKDFTGSYEVGADGGIVLPMGIKSVKVEGMSATDAAAVITKALTKVLRDPHVTVIFAGRAKMQVYVVGQVKKAGLIEVGVGDKVLQALAQAGYDETADLSRVNVRRGNEIIDLDLTKYLTGKDLAVNLQLQSGDTIVLPKVEEDTDGTVMALGQFTKTGSIPLRRGMTFRELMGLIGNVTVEADVDRITIKRDKTGDPIHVAYKRAMDGDPAADVVLQPGDTVYAAQIETAFFTVMGGVSRAGQYPLKGKLTLSEAIGLGGGPIPNSGDLARVQIVRAPGADGTAGETVNLNLNKIHKNRAAGAAHQPGRCDHCRHQEAGNVGVGDHPKHHPARVDLPAVGGACGPNPPRPLD